MVAGSLDKWTLNLASQIKLNFDDISAEDWPIILKDKDISWESAKAKITKVVNVYTASLDS